MQADLFSGMLSFSNCPWVMVRGARGPSFRVRERRSFVAEDWKCQASPVASVLRNQSRNFGIDGTKCGAGNENVRSKHYKTVFRATSVSSLAWPTSSAVQKKHEELSDSTGMDFGVAEPFLVKVANVSYFR